MRRSGAVALLVFYGCGLSIQPAALCAHSLYHHLARTYRLIAGLPGDALFTHAREHTHDHPHTHRHPHGPHDAPGGSHSHTPVVDWLLEADATRDETPDDHSVPQIQRVSDHLVPSHGADPHPPVQSPEFVRADSPRRPGGTDLEPLDRPPRTGTLAA